MLNFLHAFLIELPIAMIESLFNSAIFFAITIFALGIIIFGLTEWARHLLPENIFKKYFSK